MSVRKQNRQPEGTRAGGQFKAMDRAEAGTNLESVDPDQTYAALAAEVADANRRMHTVIAAAVAANVRALHPDARYLVLEEELEGDPYYTSAIEQHVGVGVLDSSLTQIAGPSAFTTSRTWLDRLDTTGEAPLGHLEPTERSCGEIRTAARMHGETGCVVIDINRIPGT